MNTQYHTPTTSPALPVTEELVDIPSEYITGNVKKRPTLNEFTLSDKSMKLLFKMFAAFFEHKTPGDAQDSDRGQYYTYGDVDGFTFEVDWGVFHITVSEVWDTIYDCSRPCLAKRMNDYAKRNNL